jgi:hypothetical protein
MMSEAANALQAYAATPTHKNALLLIQAIASQRELSISSNCGVHLAVFEVLLERGHYFNLLTLIGLRWAKFATKLQLKGLTDSRWADYYITRYKLTHDRHMIERLHDQIHSSVLEVMSRARFWCQLWDADPEFKNHLAEIVRKCEQPPCRVNDSSSLPG